MERGDALGAALAPGLPAALAQLVLLPLAAGSWVRRERRPRSVTVDDFHILENRDHHLSL